MVQQRAESINALELYLDIYSPKTVFHKDRFQAQCC